MKKLFLSIAVFIAVRTATAQSVLIEAPVTADTALSVHNNGTGPVGSFITRNTDNTGALIYGDHYGKGGGVRMRLMNAQNNNPGIYISNIGQGSSVFSSSNKSKAGEFYANAGNADTAVFINNDGTGTGLQVNLNYFSNSNSAVNALTKGTGKAGYFEINNPANNNAVVDVATNGNGRGVWASVNNASSFSAALYGYSAGEMGIEGLAKNIGVLGQSLPGSLSGIGVKGTSYSTSLTSGSVTGINNSSGIGVYGTATGPIGTGVWGVVTGAAAKGGYFESANYIGLTAVTISNDQYTSALVASNAGKGNGALCAAGTNGYAIYATSESANTAAGAALFETPNSSNTIDAVQIRNAGLAGALNIKNTNNSNAVTVVRVTKSGSGDYIVFEDGVGTNKVRFDNAGKGFFNGGTQAGGADMAEAFDVTGDINNYEPGDVLMIATDKDRTVTKSGNAYSDLVVGVYATKPGMLMTEENIDADISGKVPMGVVGVIPTKVCLEGGEIKRGDMLVTSSVPGVAMKADKTKIKTGQCIGKALENFNEEGVGKIKVFVNVK